MNILFQCSEYPNFRNGGIGTVTKIVAEELVGQGHHIYVVGYYSDLPQQEMVEVINGVVIYRYNLGLRKGKFRQQLLRILNKVGLAGGLIQRELSWYEERIVALIDRHKIDVLEMTDFYNFCLFHAKLLFKKFVVPTVMRVHGSASFIQYYSGKKQKWVVDNDKRHFLRMDYLCPVSFFSGNYVTDTFPFIKFLDSRIIYNPIESSFLKHNLPSEKHDILFIGKLIKTKGAFAVVDAFCRIANDFPDWKLRLAGKGDIEHFGRLIPHQLRDRVVFLGFCNRETLAVEIDNCAFACIPSYFENFSMVPLEIMGRSRAMIFTNRTSGNEIIEDGVDGFTVDPDNVEMISEKMKQLIVDEGLRNTFAKNGYEKVSSKFSAQSVVGELLTFYTNCITGEKAD